MKKHRPRKRLAAGFLKGLKENDLKVAQNNRAKLHHTLQYSSDNKAAMNTGGL